MLRGLLPPEYGLTTGFIAWFSPNGPELSSQLDIIIYDAIRYGPLIHLDICDVVPLEAVYGYVEVKASLRSSSDAAQSPADDSLEACVRKNAVIRKMRSRTFCTTGGSPMEVYEFTEEWLAPRAYIVAFEASGTVANKADALAGRMADVLEREGGAHIHGMLIPGLGFFYTRPVDSSTAADDDRHHVVYTTDHPMLAFKSLLLQGLASFRRAESSWAPAIHRYFEYKPLWVEKVPLSQRVAPSRQ